MFDVHIFGDVFAVLPKEIPFAVRAVVGCATYQSIVSFPMLFDVFAEYVKGLRMVVKSLLRAFGIGVRAVHYVVEFLIIYDNEVILILLDELHCARYDFVVVIFNIIIHVFLIEDFG